MVPFQTACGDDPEELFGKQGFCLSVDLESEMAVVLNADAKIFSRWRRRRAIPSHFLSSIGLYVAPVMLRLFGFPVRIKGEASSDERGAKTRSEDNQKEIS